MKRYTLDDFRTAEDVRKGFVNGIFTTPSMLAKHFKTMFCDGDVSVSDEKENSLIVTCTSNQWCANKYKRSFHIVYVTRQDGTHKITSAEEI